MKINSKLSLVAVALMGLALPGTGLAESDSPQRIQRPLSDFLGQQGGMSVFFSPVPDQVGFGDSDSFALVDYTGLIAEYIEQRRKNVNLGTKVDTENSSVTQIMNDDGTTSIVVELYTTNALMFSQSNDELLMHVDKNGDIQFDKTPTIFGATALCVINPHRRECDGGVPVTGSSFMYLTFTIPEPGGDLPDLVDLAGNYEDSPGPGPYAPVALYFEAEATDKDGRQLYVYQTASSKSECLDDPTSDECGLEFQLEVVEVE